MEDARVEIPRWLRNFSEAQDLRTQVALLEVSRRLTSNLGLKDGLRWRRASGLPITPVTRVLRVIEDVDGDGVSDPDMPVLPSVGVPVRF